jgi:hypothetical protein
VENKAEKKKPIDEFMIPGTKKIYAVDEERRFHTHTHHITKTKEVSHAKRFTRADCKMAESIIRSYFFGLRFVFDFKDELPPSNVSLSVRTQGWSLPFRLYRLPSRQAANRISPFTLK